MKKGTETIQNGLRCPDIQIQQYRNKEYWTNIIANQINLRKCMYVSLGRVEHDREQVRRVPTRAVRR
jgi:hypothetical protein